MATIEVYAFEDADGNADTYTTQDIDEAREYAKKNRRRLIARTFEYSDSEMIEDYTEEEADEDDGDERG